jgi:leucyl/phenylalanyl-tRNA--protein transferase
MVKAYVQLHELEYAHSVETWREGRLVGGLYGVALGSIFFGESMFTRVPDASKVALVSLVRQLQAWGFRIFDCQQPSRHIKTLGAEDIPRSEFLDHLADALTQPDRRGSWCFDSG